MTSLPFALKPKSLLALEKLIIGPFQRANLPGLHAISPTYLGPTPIETIELNLIPIELKNL